MSIRNQNTEASVVADARRIRALALYLPQFHPIPENDSWWGAGFTEWTNVAKARPLFRGQIQPNVPGELGFYDLRLSETREAQADLARAHGVEAFVYWHYWFAGRRLLERPFREVLATMRPDFPFCLGWANHTWSGIWIGASDKILIEQTYPGRKDYERHFEALLPAFADSRYVRVDGAAFFLVFRPMELPNPLEFTDTWRECAVRNGIGKLHFVGIGAPSWSPAPHGFDAVVPQWVPERGSSLWRRIVEHLPGDLPNRLRRPTVHDYAWYVKNAVSGTIGRRSDGWEYGFAMPNWDNTPRAGSRGVVLQGSTPALFQDMVHRVRGEYERKDVPLENRLLVIKSWNEWAEGNYLEPDRATGRAFLEALKEEVMAPAVPRPDDVYGNEGP